MSTALADAPKYVEDPVITEDNATRKEWRDRVATATNRFKGKDVGRIFKAVRGVYGAYPEGHIFSEKDFVAHTPIPTTGKKLEIAMAQIVPETYHRDLLARGLLLGKSNRAGIIEDESRTWKPEPAPLSVGAAVVTPIMPEGEMPAQAAAPNTVTEGNQSPDHQRRKVAFL